MVKRKEFFSLFTIRWRYRRFELAECIFDFIAGRTSFTFTYCMIDDFYLTFTNALLTFKSVARSDPRCSHAPMFVKQSKSVPAERGDAVKLGRLTLLVGRQEERPTCKGLNDEVLAWSKMQGVAYGPADVTATSSSVASLKSRLV